MMLTCATQAEGISLTEGLDKNVLGIKKCNIKYNNGDCFTSPKHLSCDLTGHPTIFGWEKTYISINICANHGQMT